MKHIYAFFIIISALCCCSTVNGQYYLTGISVADSGLDTVCSTPTNFEIRTNAYSASLTVKIYRGDGTFVVQPVLNGASYGYVNSHYNYSSPGTYTTKVVLYNGGSPVDSLVGNFESLGCSKIIIKTFNDINGDGVFDTTTERLGTTLLSMEVSENGTPRDTVEIISGVYYTFLSGAGTIFTFRLLPRPGLIVTYPSGGIVTDTAKAMVNGYAVKMFGVNCSTAPGYDALVAASARAGVHKFESKIIVNNEYCSPQNATLTMTCSPKYTFHKASVTPTSIIGNTLTWDISGLSLMNVQYITAIYERGLLPLLLPGDTVTSTYTVTPTIGDSDPSNNYMIRVDTVTSSFDPNEIEVSPEGNIIAGTELTYTVHFENTGNDTAFNIHVMDTLSDDLDIESFKVINATAPMIISREGWAGNVIKFDFPAINLLDSSHHGLNTGMFTFSINSKTGLTNGTRIKNRAGIYFDYNEVVLTNTVTNIIGFPAETQVMTATRDVKIYPNPARTELFIDNVNHAFDNVSITNIVGQQLYNGELKDTQTKIDVRSLPAGTYFVTLKGAAGVKTQQFQRQ